MGSILVDTDAVFEPTKKISSGGDQNQSLVCSRPSLVALNPVDDGDTARKLGIRRVEPRCMAAELVRTVWIVILVSGLVRVTAQVGEGKDSEGWLLGKASWGCLRCVQNVLRSVNAIDANGVGDVL